MGNISFGNSYLILSKFKLFPKYTKVEKKANNLAAKYQSVLDFENSDAFKKYLEDKEYFASKAYQEELKKLREQDAKEELEALEKRKKDFEAFGNSKAFKEYYSKKADPAIEELRKYKVVFEDDFQGNKLDTDKWTTHYYSGVDAMDEAYALASDFAFPTDGNNIDVSGGKAKITLRAEKTKGKTWKLPYGFVDREYNYTTGLMNTAKSFRGKYGKIEAKVKITHAANASFLFYLGTEKMLPHIDLFRIEDNKKAYSSGSLWGKNINTHQRAQGHFSGIDFTQDYFIFTFLWGPKKMVWKINGEVVNEQTAGIPDEEMFLAFNLRGIGEKIDAPAAMEIAWVKWSQATE